MIAADTGQAIELYWLHPTSNGGHELGAFQVQVQARVREVDDSNVATTTWGAWSEWQSLNDATTDNGYEDSEAFTVDNGDEQTDPTITLLIDSTPTEPAETVTVDENGAVESTLGDPWNLRITGAVAGQYKFRIKSKQGGDEAGLDLESGWVVFNRPSRAGLGYINYPVANIYNTEIPLDPELIARALDADDVDDQGIGLTWEPDVAERDGFDHDDDGTTDAIDDVVPPEPSDYRIDVSEDGVNWTAGQSRTVSLRRWDHKRLSSGETRYYRLFPINHGEFGEADIAGGQSKQAVIASA